MSSAERAELLGEIIDDRYQIEERIGIGGTGVVFSARRLEDDATVVIKVLRPLYAHNPDLARRLQREAEIPRRVAHPGIVPVIDSGFLPDGSPYVTMLLARGEGLNELLFRAGPLGVSETAVVLHRVADILHRAHAEGYVHRDVKPEHILLDRAESGDLRVTLLDFGVCAAQTAPEDERERERGRVFGTPTYVSPEQATGNPDVDGRADIFGLGVVAFEALTGRPPFKARDVTSLLRRIIREDAPRAGLVAPHVGARVDELVARMMARNPDERFPSARAVTRALAPLLSNRRSVERNLAAGLHVDAASRHASPTVPQERYLGRMSRRPTARAKQNMAKQNVAKQNVA